MRPQTAISSEKVAAEFLARHVKKLAPASRVSAARLSIKESFRPFRGKRLSEIKRHDVIKFLDGIVDRGAPVSANRTLSLLKCMANFAVQRGIMDVSPIAE